MFVAFGAALLSFSLLPVISNLRSIAPSSSESRSSPCAVEMCGVDRKLLPVRATPTSSRVSGRLQRALLALDDKVRAPMRTLNCLETYSPFITRRLRWFRSLWWATATPTPASLRNSASHWLVVSHRFKLVVKTFSVGHESLSQTVNNLVSQLHQPNNAVELRNLSPIRAKKHNAARWSSTYDVLERCVGLRPHIRAVEAVKETIFLPAVSTSSWATCCITYVTSTVCTSGCSANRRP